LNTSRQRALLAKRAFESLASGEDPLVLLRHAEAVHQAHWALLDGIDALTHGLATGPEL
jgi:hypothetical protein